MLEMAREVSKRSEDFILSAPTFGTTTTIVDQTLLTAWPVNLNQNTSYVYSCQSNNDGNQGLERRAVSWSTANWTLTLQPPGFPNPIGGFPTPTAVSAYEIRFMNSRERVVEAINSAIGQLAMYCLRDVKDESLVGVNNTWKYILPATQFWARVFDVEIQVNTTFNTFPFVRANDMGLRWRVERTVDTSGNEQFALQFSSQPPIGYVIRVWGQAWYPDLGNDMDSLAISGKWTRMVLEWVYEWAQAKLAEWNWSAFATGESKQAHDRMVAHLQEAKSSILEQMKVDQPGVLITPANAMQGPSWNDPVYLGAYTSGGFARAPFNPAGG